MLFLQYPWKFFVLNLPSCFDNSGIAHIYIYIYIHIYITGWRKTVKYDSKFHAIDAIIRYSNCSTWFWSQWSIFLLLQLISYYLHVFNFLWVRWGWLYLNLEMKPKYLTKSDVQLNPNILRTKMIKGYCKKH